MGYIGIKEVKQIRQALKIALPEFKFSVRRRHASTVIISFVSGAADLGEYSQLNVYHLGNIENTALRAAAQKVLKTANIVKSPTYHETGDYGTQPDFYLSIEVGSWNQPYLQKLAKEKVTSLLRFTQAECDHINQLICTDADGISNPFHGRPCL